MGLFLTTAAVTATAMLLLWCVSLVRRDASIVDIYWGPGFAVIAATAWWVAAPPTPRGTAVALLVAVWGLRLGGYLLWRNGGREEDFRYQAMRRRRGDRFALWSLPGVFGLQGAVMWIVSLPVQVTVASPNAAAFGAIEIVGLALFAVGLTFETVGDAQLARFRADPDNRGAVLDTGLWRYTRHPNYFGDFCVWWGLYAFAVPIGGAWTVLGPVLMSVMLLRVSGVALLERSIGKRRPAYADYIRRTSAFVPFPPKRPETPPNSGIAPG